MSLKTNKERSIRSVTKSLYNGDTKFDLTFFEINEKIFHCNMLKDMSAISFDSSIKLNRNSKILVLALDELSEAGEILTERAENINERIKNEGETEDLKKLRADTDKLIVEHNNRTISVHLYTLDQADFPTDKEKFGSKLIQSGQRDRFASFLELLGNIIKEKP